MDGREGEWNERLDIHAERRIRPITTLRATLLVNSQWQQMFPRMGKLLLLHCAHNRTWGKITFVETRSGQKEGRDGEIDFRLGRLTVFSFPPRPHP